jgi:hypothetical protein
MPAVRFRGEEGGGGWPSRCRGGPATESERGAIGKAVGLSRLFDSIESLGGHILNDALATKGNAKDFRYRESPFRGRLRECECASGVPNSQV